MKTCIKCKDPKPLEDFYTHPQTSDGRLGKCKQCCKDDAKIRHIDKYAEIREYDRLRNKLPHNVARRKKYAEENPEVVRAIRKRWEEKNPEKAKAAQTLTNAVRDKMISKKPCEVCGNEKVEAHHDDYTKPLEVRWLCKKHHWVADQVRRQREALTVIQEL
jgi:hypothetical protein